ncbi:MAG: rod shape-determining protein MreC [Flavobacteriales bacterium]|nr:rod shape-determining protein MreC [Flavobacteriales bacterium]
MRDLFRFLYRIRDTLLFLLLLVVALVRLFSGNMHHRAQALTSSTAIVGDLYSWRADVAGYASLRDVNTALAQENAMLRARIPYVATDTASSPPMVDSLGHTLFRFLPAQVINSTVLKQKNYLTLNKGARDGIVPGMGVIGTHGILGVTWNSSANFTTVVSILNTDLSSSVKLASSGHFGLLVWDTSDPQRAHVRDIATHVPVAPGDTVSTRGGDGVFPADIPVGIVESVLEEAGSNYHLILIRFTEDMSRSGVAYVVNDLQRAERDSLHQRISTP